ncbi:MAG: hypothetical protein RL030_2782 [Pseudomonadota bacterium]|jgi:hypothetical protein
MSDQALNIRHADRLRALRDRLRILAKRGEWDQASVCADLILDLLGLRPYPWEHQR